MKTVCELPFYLATSLTSGFFLSSAKIMPGSNFVKKNVATFQSNKLALHQTQNGGPS